MSVLSTRLRLLRERYGETQEQTAQAVGTTRVSITNWESARTNPRWDDLARLAEHFGTTVDYLVGRVDQRQPPSAGEAPAPLPLARQLEEAMTARRLSLPEVAAAAGVPVASLLAIQEGRVEAVAPEHRHDLARWLEVPQDQSDGSAGDRPVERRHRPRTAGSAASASRALTAQELRIVEEVVRRLRGEVPIPGEDESPSRPD